MIDAMRAGLDAGMNWIDTAEVYGKGVSEGIVGRAVAGRRDQVLVASKLAPASEGSGFRPEQVRAGCEASLGRLGIDVIDLYQLHWPDATGVPVEDTWGAMAELQDAGTVRSIGVSNFDQGADRAMRGDPPRGLAPAGVLDAGVGRPRADPLVRRAGNRRGDVRPARVRAADRRDLPGAGGVGRRTGGAPRRTARSPTRSSAPTSPIVDGLRPDRRAARHHAWRSSRWRGTSRSPA